MQTWGVDLGSGLMPLGRCLSSHWPSEDNEAASAGRQMDDGSIGLRSGVDRHRPALRLWDDFSVPVGAWLSEERDSMSLFSDNNTPSLYRQGRLYEKILLRLRLQGVFCVKDSINQNQIIQAMSTA